MRARIGILLTVLLISAGCASYGPYSFWSRNDSGYSDLQLSRNQWQVVYRGNTLMSAEKVIDFTLLRAAELSITHGYRYFAIVASGDHSRTTVLVTPGRGYGETSASATCPRSGVVCTATGSTVYTYVPPMAYQFVRPGVAIQIAAYKAQPQGAQVFDAVLIYRSVRAKYDIR